MTHTRLWLVATIIAGIILVGFVLTVPHTRDIGELSAPSNATTTVPNVAIRDTYRKGVHTITGTVEAPNLCTSLSAIATFLNASSSSESILVALTLPEDTGVCLQQVVHLSFSTTAAAPANVPITATVNGVTATVTAL
jgi:hypothetical protein